jgi:3'-phosphoadenosine 5'-phosphosulfate sulfotransferase (PAPS reductase)/FAD synthetase
VREKEAIQTIERYRRYFDETAVMFSGGRDSLVVADLARRACPDIYLLFIDTTVALPETVAFVHRAADHLGMHLEVVRNPYGTFKDAVLRWGFPTPGRRWCLWYLKISALREFIKDHPSLLLLTGLRADESARRQRLTASGKIAPYVENANGVPTLSPIFYWSAREVRDYIGSRGLPTNDRIWDILHFSGECLCGAFQTKGELRLIRMASPRAFDTLMDIEMSLNDDRRRSRYIAWQRTGATAKGIAQETTLDRFLCGSCQFKGVQ